MGRKSSCSKEGLNKGAWTPLEDKVLIDYIKVHGEGKWRNLPKRAGLKRCGKSCRLRWLNYLRLDIKRGNISPDEEDLIIRLHKLLGNSRKATRTNREIKNYWNTNIGRKLQEFGAAKPNQMAQLQQNNQEHKVHQDSHYVLQPDVGNGGSSSSLSPSLVVHTKIIRCTKVFVNPQNIDQSLYNETTENDNGDKAKTEENGTTNIIVTSSSSSLSISSLYEQQQQPVSGSYSPINMSGELENYNFNIMFNFDVDDPFLSELLNAPDLRDQILENSTISTVAGDGVGDINNSSKNGRQRSYFLPSSSQISIFSEETQHNDLELWINGFSSC
ncbi:unnamed protein product [Withania somnifera]